MNYIVITENELPGFLSEERSEISGYEFKEINLTDANLKSAVFVDCKFSNCNMAKKRQKLFYRSALRKNERSAVFVSRSYCSFAGSRCPGGVLVLQSTSTTSPS